MSEDNLDSQDIEFNGRLSYLTKRQDLILRDIGAINNDFKNMHGKFEKMKSNLNKMQISQ